MLNSFQKLVGRVDSTVTMDNIIVGLSVSTGHFQNSVARAWMQLPFSPVELCAAFGDVAVCVAYACELFGWGLSELMLDPDSASDHEALAVAVVGRNPVALSLVVGSIVGDIAEVASSYESSDTLKLRFSMLITAMSILSNMHAIDFLLSCLPEKIDDMKREFPSLFEDIEPMNRLEKKSVIYTGTESRH